MIEKLFIIKDTIAFLSKNTLNNTDEHIIHFMGLDVVFLILTYIQQPTQNCPLNSMLYTLQLCIHLRLHPKQPPDMN